MNWIKENKKLASILGVTLVGAIALGVLLYLAIADYGAKKEQWESTGRNIATLKKAKLYPNESNLTEKAEKISDYEGKVNALRQALLAPTVQQPVAPISETEFQAKLRSQVSEIKRKAETSNVRLPSSDFALGFDEYTASLPRNAEVAAELGVQLNVVDKLISLLIDSAVVSVDSFERVKLPNEKGDAPASANQANRGQNQQSPGSANRVDTAPVLDRYPIKLTFTADQGPLQAVINNLSDPAKTPDFLVVRLLRVENSKPEGPRIEDVTSQRNQVSAVVTPQDGAVPAAADAQLILPPPAAPPAAVTIMGDEKLKVQVELDYVRFRAPETADAKDSAATAK